jgi:ribose/xylose/arabinose/galactoside ABC-type transport system permease subunit
LAALLSSVAGILYAARQGQGDAESAVGYELSAIAAAVVGGCNLRGGQGTIAGTILGVMFLTIVVNGIANVIKVDSTQWEGLVMGLVLILAVAVNRLKREA